ncbi:MAG: hypothetical protein JNJ54_13750 [Myxococcaceae bacterium]|nr:hypothetical protein [Myxococcaceae bacterium]
MVRTGKRFPWLVLVGVFAACGGMGGGGCGGGCAGFQQLPQGTYTGPRLDSAGAIRVSQQGFAYLNSDAGVATVLSVIAPGGTLRVPIPCSVQTSTLFGIPALQLVVGDEGSLLCTQESCGQMDGRCTMADEPREVVINITSLRFTPKSPDLIEARISATLQTGLIHISSVSRNACLFTGPIKCSVDFDTARAAPAFTELGLNIKLAIDTRWDRLLALEVADVEGSTTCTGGASPPTCIDGNDIVLARPPGTNCSLCTITNIGPVKNLIIGQLTDSLQKQLNKALAEVNCAKCSNGMCPMSTQAGITSMCVPEDGGPGTCAESGSGRCVPGLIGVEGRADVSTALQGLVPRGSELELAFGAGGLVASSPQGTTIGLRGGVREVQPAACVAPKSRPAPVMLPLPDFDLDAPATGYDLAFSLSQQVLSETLYRVQQSGALCIEVGNETVAQLESGVLAALLPSLAKFTDNQSVPLRIAIRPVNPPTMVVGQGTVDMSGQIIDPLLTLDWPALEIDVYALLEDRYARLFTVQADLKLPLGLDVQGCDRLRPVVGNLMMAIQRPKVINSELLAENTAALEALVPQILSLAERQLAAGFPTFQLPDLQGFAFRIQLLRARGVGQIAGTTTYNHLGLYARLYPRTDACPVPLQAEEAALWLSSRDDTTVRVMGLGTQEISFRVDEGFWSVWQPADAFGQAVVQHPILKLRGRHVVEVRGADGRVGRLELEN